MSVKRTITVTLAVDIDGERVATEQELDSIGFAAAAQAWDGDDALPLAAFPDYHVSVTTDTTPDVATG